MLESEHCHRCGVFLRFSQWFRQLDYVALPDLNLKWPRPQIGLVYQESVFFVTITKENVASGFIGSPYGHLTKRS